MAPGPPGAPPEPGATDGVEIGRSETGSQQRPKDGFSSQKMLLIDEVRKEIAAAKKLRIPWWGLVSIVIVTVPISWLFDRFGKLDVVLPTLNCVGVFVFLLVLKWRLRRHTWFWGTVTLLAALHVALILFVPWTSGWVPALLIAVIGSLDLCLMLWIVTIVRRFVEGRTS